MAAAHHPPTVAAGNGRPTRGRSRRRRGLPAAAAAPDGADPAEPITAPAVAAATARSGAAELDSAPVAAAQTRGSGAARVLAEFRYDPADPTPAVGGRLLTPDAGVRDNRRLAARADVVTFTTPPLHRDLVIAGTARVELDHVADPPHADLFVRLCDVAPNGRAHNIADGMRRREPAAGRSRWSWTRASTASRPDIGSPCWSRAARTRASCATTAPASHRPTRSASYR